MSDVTTTTRAQPAPETVYLKDYQPPAYWIDEVNLAFDLYEDHALVSSNMQLRRNQRRAGAMQQVVLNGENLELLSIKIDGVLLQVSHYVVTANSLTIKNVPDDFTLEIVVKIFPDKNTALSGLYRSGQTYCTQCEAEGFRRITYYMDHPDVLAKFTTKISADAVRYPVLLSNGNLIESGKQDSGRHWVVWQDPFKKPCYLFALVAGDFDLLEDEFKTISGNDVALKVYVDKGYGDQSAHAMYSIKEAMRWDERAFGREYDLDNFMIVAIGDFNMGAMENKGLNIFNTKYILAKPETATDDDYIHILSVVGHEYFHNWSGNRVTCRDWFQLSLKEGLTIFRDQLFTEDLVSQAVMRIRDVNRLREAQFPEDAGPLAHPVRPDSYIEINNFYTSTVYEKGAEVLRMLRTILGVDMFRKGMDLYFSRHDGQAVTIEDYVRAMEDVSGVNLTQFRRWYSQAGTPLVTVTGEYDENEKSYSLTMHQRTLPTPGQPDKQPLDIPIRAGFVDIEGKVIPLQPDVLRLTEVTQTVKFTNVARRPIPSLLRDFSAPVKLNFPYADEELICLFKHDSDSFNRWEAGQKYILMTLIALIRQHQLKKNLAINPELSLMFEYVLMHDINDEFFLAELLCLPSEKYIGEQLDVIDVDAIHQVREFVLTQLAWQLESVFLALYEKLRDEQAQHTFDARQVGRRQLKNVCLSYLMRLPKYAELGYQQFQNSLHTNMTDTQAALTALANIHTPLRQQALDEFFLTWRHDPLVVDKWFAIQAASKLPDTLKTVTELLQHPNFDIKNPNKVYALIGGFGFRNAINFHRIDGLGYSFLREFIAQLDTLNPQVAGRMLNPLTTWKRYDTERQKLMRKQLERLMHDKKLSTDLYELVSKSLE